MKTRMKKIGSVLKLAATFMILMCAQSLLQAQEGGTVEAVQVTLAPEAQEVLTIMQNCNRQLQDEVFSKNGRLNEMSKYKLNDTDFAYVLSASRQISWTKSIYLGQLDVMFEKRSANAPIAADARSMKITCKFTPVADER